MDRRGRTPNRGHGPLLPDAAVLCAFAPLRENAVQLSMGYFSAAVHPHWPGLPGLFSTGLRNQANPLFAGNLRDELERPLALLHDEIHGKVEGLL